MQHSVGVSVPRKICLKELENLINVMSVWFESKSFSPSWHKKSVNRFKG